MKHIPLRAALAAIIVAGTVTGFAQELTGPPANPQFKYSTSMPPGVAAPSTIETRLGTLNLFDGFPDEATAQKLWDNLDFQRAVQAYLLALPAVKPGVRSQCHPDARSGQSHAPDLGAVGGLAHGRPDI